MLIARLIGKCPALECPGGVRPIYRDAQPDVHRRLQDVSGGLAYDYYHCERCKLLWQIRQIEIGRPYEVPELIGHWEDNALGGACDVYDRPHNVTLDYTYRRSAHDPARPAKNKTDATRRKR